MKRILSLLLLLCVSAHAQTFASYTKIVADAAALQALNPSDIHQVVRMRGYANAAAADGAIFYYDSTSATATNTVSVFKPTSVSGNGRWLRQDLMFQAGSTTVPSITFGLDPNTGFANSTADQIDIILGGLRKWYIPSTGVLTATGAQTVSTATGDLTLNTGAANGNILLNPNGTGGVGIGATPSAGANSLKIGGTTASTTTATGSLINAGGFGNAGAANIGGVTAVTDTTEATTGGAAALKSSGGVYAAKKIVGNTDLIVNTSLLYADSAASKVGIGTTGPDRKLDILDASNPQLRLSQADGTVYTDAQTLSTGHLVVTTSGGNRITSTTVNDTSVLARQVQGGLAFDGVTTTAKDTHTLSANIGTSDFSYATRLLVPSAIPSATIGIVTISSTGVYAANDSMVIFIDTSGDMSLRLYDGAGGYKQSRVAGVVTAYAGKVIDCAWIRVTATPSMTVYINGVAQTTIESTSGAATFANTLTSTYAVVGFATTSILWNSTIFSATLFNRALSASEVITLSNQGVSEADKWGSLTAKYTSDFSAGVDGASTSAGAVAGNIDSIGGEDDWLRFTIDSATGLHRVNVNSSAAVVAGRRYRLTFKYYVPSSNSSMTYFSTWYGLGAIKLANQTTQNATTTYTTEFTATVSGDIRMYANDGSSVTDPGGDDVFYLKSIQLTQIGSILDADLSAGVGYQVPDRSSNNYHGLVSTSGTAWTIPRYHFQAMYNIAASGYLGDATSRAVIPGNARIESITAYSAAGTPTFTVGDDAGAANNFNAGLGPLTAAQGTDVPLLKRFATTGTDGRIYVAFTAGAAATTFTIDYTVPGNF